jgi:hypothetical protein
VIGIFVAEEFVAIEFRPIAGSEKLRWAKLSLNVELNPKYWGEFGFAFGKNRLWVYRGLEIKFLRYPQWLYRLLTRTAL